MNDIPPTTTGAAAHKRWTNKQLLLIAETTVVGRCGIDTVYYALKMIRDDERRPLLARIAELQSQLDTALEEIERSRARYEATIEDGLYPASDGREGTVQDERPET